MSPFAARVVLKRYRSLFCNQISDISPLAAALTTNTTLEGLG
jgi:hypothetical protein